MTPRIDNIWAIPMTNTASPKNNITGMNDKSTTAAVMVFLYPGGNIACLIFSPGVPKGIELES